MSRIFDELLAIAGFLALVALIGIPIGFWRSRNKKKKYSAAFAEREPLTDTGFFETYFAHRGVPPEITIKVRRVLEEVLDSDLSRLSADDDFGKNLSFFFQYDSMADVEIVCKLEETFQIKITNQEAQGTHTVDDVVNLVWRKLYERAQQPPAATLPQTF